MSRGCPAKPLPRKNRISLNAMSAISTSAMQLHGVRRTLRLDSDEPVPRPPRRPRRPQDPPRGEPATRPAGPASRTADVPGAERRAAGTSAAPCGRASLLPEVAGQRGGPTLFRGARGGRGRQSVLQIVRRGGFVDEFTVFRVPAEGPAFYLGLRIGDTGLGLVAKANPGPRRRRGSCSASVSTTSTRRSAGWRGWALGPRRPQRHAVGTARRPHPGPRRQPGEPHSADPGPVTLFRGRVLIVGYPR